MNDFVSVVIPHYGRRSLTEACIQALDQNTKEDFELVVVDNGTGDTFDVDIEIHNPVNQGFAVACNQGAKAATGSICVFLNNDTQVHAGWLTPLVEALKEPKVGIAGSLLLYPNGEIQHSGVYLKFQGTTLMCWNWMTPRNRGPVAAVTGACMAMRRDVWGMVGGFDERYWNGAEDVDLCLKVATAGYACMYDPASVVTHRESASGAERWSRVHENVARFHQKWGSSPVALPLVWDPLREAFSE